MKTISRKSALSVFVIFAVFTGLSLATRAQADNTRPAHTGKDKGGFSVGVCVGQSLAHQGIDLPPPKAGEFPKWDPAMRTAFKTAADTCRAQFKAAGFDHTGE